MTAEPLPGLTVTEGLTGRDLHRLRAAVRDGHSPRVRMLACAGQVAGQRGAVVAVGRLGGDMVEFIHVRMDRDGDVLPFAPPRSAPARGIAHGAGRGRPEEQRGGPLSALVRDARVSPKRLTPVATTNATPAPAETDLFSSKVSGSATDGARRGHARPSGGRR